MGLMGKILGKSDSQIIKEEVRKEADRQAKLNMTIAEQYGALASCRDTFERVIAMDRLNALERREKRIRRRRLRRAGFTMPPLVSWP